MTPAFQPGDRVSVSYSTGVTQGEILSEARWSGWWLVRQPYGDDFIDVECAEEYIVREGEPPALDPFAQLIARQLRP